MELPKTIDGLIERRKRLAFQLSEVCYELDDWLDKNEIETEPFDTHGGVEIFENPTDSANRIREAIKKK